MNTKAFLKLLQVLLPVALIITSCGPDSSRETRRRGYRPKKIQWRLLTSPQRPPRQGLPLQRPPCQGTLLPPYLPMTLLILTR